MFIDASAIVAILAREPGYEEIEKRLSDVPGPFLVSPLVKFEAATALARAKSADRKPSPDMLRRAALAIEAFAQDLGADEMSISPEIGQVALEASARFGKAVGHPADLNFGDCFSYACARSAAAPLLYKGYDFARTDLA